MKLEAIEIVEDRTASSRCDEGFLRLARLVVKNLYDDGSESAPYPCDVMTRPGGDAVVAVIYEIGADGLIYVLLREAARVPVYLRRHKRFEHPDLREYLSLHEVVAGIVEPGDGPGEAGLRRRAAIEAREEAGLEIPEEAFEPLGGEAFSSPGTTDEKLLFVAGGAPLDEARSPAGDGSVMEEWGRLHRLELSAAIRACRRGEIPDLKTEVALLRLADHLGWLPQLRCFVHELPEEWRPRHDAAGMPPARGG